jgi:hypothetical protein
MVLFDLPVNSEFVEHASAFQIGFSPANFITLKIVINNRIVPAPSIRALMIRENKK